MLKEIPPKYFPLKNKHGEIRQYFRNIIGIANQILSCQGGSCDVNINDSRLLGNQAGSSRKSWGGGIFECMHYSGFRSAFLQQMDTFVE